ncbi:MAG: hypothetical protein HC923_00725 [Myxococcales bacterium]|nr:hypothetical protein [Myxococcales bacterium]
MDAGPVAVRILSFNDFHGHLLPNEDGSGGVAKLASLIDRQRTTNTLVVSPGDLVGASPLVSAHFKDQPTIEAMNLLGLDVFGLGNHEFDEGLDELRRLQHGDPTSGFEGSRFPFLGANVHRGDGVPIFDPYVVKEVGGVEVAFIGLTLEDTKEIVAPDLGDLQFADEVETISRYVYQLRERGIQAFVILLHEGGWQKGGINDCSDLEGPVVDIVKQLPAEVDVVLSGHTHRTYNCEIDGKLLTAAGSNGKLLTQVDLEISPVTRDVIRKSAENLVVDASLPDEPEIARSSPVTSRR